MIKREEKETQEETEGEGIITAIKPLIYLIIWFGVIIAFSLI